MGLGVNDSRNTWLACSLGGGGVSLNVVPWYASTYKKKDEKGVMFVRLVGSWDLQKGVFSQKRVGVG